MDASYVLDLSKENVQPLIHGRNTSKLSTVLQADSNYELQQTLKKQREEFELQIRMYDGDDPLQLRYDYVQWLEQSYPSLGPETNIVPFLEDTLVAFKNIDQYKQDPRYVSLVIKYIGTQPNPLEIYNLVYSENIGTKLAMFYKAWAEELDAHNDVKQANHVFQLGLNAQAEPIQELEEAQMQFHMCVGRRFLLNGPDEPSVPREEGQRQVLGKLSKKVTPGMTRLKSTTSSRLPMANSDVNIQPAGLNVYMDQNDEENMYLKEPSMKNSHFKIKADLIHKENTEKPGVWTKKKTKNCAMPVPRHPSTPSFVVHVDEDAQFPAPSPMQTSVQMTSALKPKKISSQEARHASVLFESDNSKEINMFCKNKIYLGKSELQFEELRAARLMKEKYGTCVPSKLVASQEENIPVCISEPEDNSKLPMYRKKQVYIGANKEVQLEELRALHHKTWKAQVYPKVEEKEVDILVCVPDFNKKAKPMYRKPEIYIGNNKEIQLEEIRASIYKARQSLIKRESCISQLTTIQAAPFTELTSGPIDNVQNKSYQNLSNQSDDAPKLTKALTFSTSDDDSLDKKSATDDSKDTSDKKSSADSAKTLGLFDNSDKNVSCNIQMNNLMEDDCGKDVLSFLDDMWKSPACNKNKGSTSFKNDSKHESNEKPRQPVVPLIFETNVNQNKLDVSGVTMNYTVNTKEAMKLVQDMWNSSSPLQVTPTKCSNAEDKTFKKPVSMKKSSFLSSQSTTDSAPGVVAPFKIYSSDNQVTPEERQSNDLKTPKFNVYTDEETVPRRSESKTPKFSVYTDEDEKARASPPPSSPLRVEAKTPKFNIYTDEEEDEIKDGQISGKTCPTSSKMKSDTVNPIIPVVQEPKTPFNIFCDEPEEDNQQPQKTKKHPKALTFDNDSDSAPSIVSNNGHVEYKNMSSPEMEISFKRSQQNCAMHSDLENVLPVEMYDVYPVPPPVKKMPIVIHYDEEDDGELGQPLEQETVPKQSKPLQLPYVAPPSNKDNEPLGHEFKENFPPFDSVKNKTSSNDKNQRVLNGYLVPSNIQFNVHQEEEERDMEEEVEMSDVTCNTRAFNFVLPSSTPFLTMRSKSASYTPGSNVNGSFLQEPSSSSVAPAQTTHSYKTENETLNLSIILEASKEKSSSSSGSSGSSVAPSSYWSEKKTMLTPIHEHNGMSDLEVSVADLAINNIDPFDDKLIYELLTQRVQFPLARHRVGYECFFSTLGPLKLNSKPMFGSTEYTIIQELGKGAYARVLMGKTKDNEKVALKQQRPACEWEWYICKEMETRLKNCSLEHAVRYFLVPKHIYVFKNSSILVSDWAKYGNLLDLVNLHKLKMGKPLNFQAAIKLNLEMARAVHAMHKVQIIHGDIKPDNFVVCNLLKTDVPSLKLIDFGRSIDMTLFPPGTSFSTVITTDGFVCNEMKEGHRWNYHTDLYALAGSMFCTLMGKYMNTIKKGTKWGLTDTIPRYLQRNLWEPIFDKLLNVPFHYELTLLEEIIFSLEQSSNFTNKDGLQTVDDLLLQLK